MRLDSYVSVNISKPITNITLFHRQLILIPHVHCPFVLVQASYSGVLSAIRDRTTVPNIDQKISDKREILGISVGDTGRRGYVMLAETPAVRVTPIPEYVSSWCSGIALQTPRIQLIGSSKKGLLCCVSSMVSNGYARDSMQLAPASLALAPYHAYIYSFFYSFSLKL